MSLKRFAAPGLLAALLFLPATGANAAIKCQGAYQQNSAAGGLIASKYCEDNLLASIARAAGMSVSNKQVRQNPHKKREACTLVGYDPRVQNICAGTVFNGRGRR